MSRLWAAVPALLILATWSPASAGQQSNAQWTALIENIARSSLLNTRPGSTLAQDVEALIFFFNKTCTASQEVKVEAVKPYRGAFAQISQWREQTGWRSIVQAHAAVAVQCRALYMEGGEEFAAKHCFWNIQSRLPRGNGTVYPSPRWTIVEDCCEALERPLLRVNDAVWATTRGVGRAYRLAEVQPGVQQALADDYGYIPKIKCDQDINEESLDCDSSTHNIFTTANQRCTASANCPPSAKPIGVRSNHYFNVGLAVGDYGVLVRTMDGGYTWDCVRGCTRGVDMPNLNSISVNVRLGGFGYDRAYYNAQGGANVDGIDWTLLTLEAGQSLYTGMDGVYWPEQNGVYMEGYVVGASGTIVKLANAGVNGWDPADVANLQPDTKQLVEVTPTNADGTGCQTQKSINDVFFWNMHLAFFVGDFGYICRLGMEIQAEYSARGPGRSIDDIIDGTVALTWDLQGSDEQGLNWGRIVDNKDYMYSNLRSIFCLQTDELDLTQWSAEQMDVESGITYSQHMTCFAVGTHPGTAGTSSAILKYQSQAVPLGTDPVEFNENVQWKPQNSRTSTTLNDVYCIKTKSAGRVFVASDDLFCYAVGDGGLIRFTSNGGRSPWRTRFSGVQENLRKVVIIEVTHAMSGQTGDNAVVIGDNGCVLRTLDGGNTWEKLERVTPEHLVAVQFNAFDDFYYATGGNDVSAEYNYFESGNDNALPFGNGIATGAVMFDWMSRTGSCGVGSPNAGTSANRYYDCRKPELSIVLRTNCQSTLQAGPPGRCQYECADPTATVPIALEHTLASDVMWKRYFGSETVMVNNQPTLRSLVERLPGVALYGRSPACDEVWTAGHGRPWHTDTRETRLYQTAAINTDTGLFESFEDAKAIRPAHELCIYGWPRHKYRMHEGRRCRRVDNATCVTPTISEYTFLGRYRYSEDNCTLLGGRYYAQDANHLGPDCVFDFGTLQACPSWEVHGMGHSMDSPSVPKATSIPFVNFSVITDPCNDNWFGITCEAYSTDDALPHAIANQSVTQIWLYSNNLQGEVPIMIRDLLSLRSFSLGSNKLVGTIPTDVWVNMTSLRYLSLAGNFLEGEIPVTFRELGASLEELRVHANRLTGEIPSELGQLGKLRSLSVHGNSLDGRIPSQLGNLTSLQYLWVSSNNLTGALPSEVGNLENLRYLWFANNSIDAIPEELGSLVNLRSMDGSNNTIADRLPYSLGKLQRLRVLKLGNNDIRATIPDALGMCTTLVVLELQRNHLVGPVPASFGALQELTSLDVSHNSLERELPDSIEGMRSLQSLLVQNNNLEGGLPASIGTLRNLASLNVADNKMTKSLPDELSECDKLEMLDLQSNAIDGPLPQGIWRMQALEYLYLTRNHVRGPLPEGLGYLRAIRELRLDNNKIDGTLPPTIGDAATLQVMRLDQNVLSGSLPSTIGKLANVELLDMSRNRLGGTIPPEIMGRESAEQVYLHKNSLRGQIPDTVGNLSSLQELRISQNVISGTIPPSLGKLEYLRELQLDANSIGGAIPEELGELKRRIRTMHLQNNNLNGLLPTFFRQAVFRDVAIALGGNPFWCPLPGWPSLNGTASCVHCPNDIYLEDDHRTCSDHGVCVDGVSCRCDPKWDGSTCSTLRCDGPLDGCNDHGECINDKEPSTCTLADGNETDAAVGLCEKLLDDCIEAYHECPHKGGSIQVDSAGIVIAEAAKHNQIVYAKCVCADAWSGNDCTMPPLPPPTIEPWPDPYKEFDLATMAASPAARCRQLGGATLADAWRASALAVAVAVAVLWSAVHEHEVAGGRARARVRRDADAHPSLWCMRARARGASE